MISKALILSIILGVLALIVVIYFIIQMAKKKVWITALVKNNLTNTEKMEHIGYMNYGSDGEVSLVYLSGTKGNAIGRIKLEENGEKCKISVLKTPIDEPAEEARYRNCGFITPDGFIFKQLSPKDKPEKIGYTAKPSDPNTPTIKGERSWKSLWLRKYLDAYIGMPEDTIEDNKTASTTTANSFHALVINADASDDKDIVEIPEVNVKTVVDETIAINEPLGEETQEQQYVEDKEDQLKKTENTSELVLEDCSEESSKDIEEPSLNSEEIERLDKIKAENKKALEQIARNMVSVNGGTFLMGRKTPTNPDENKEPRGKVESNECPEHKVTLSSYFIGKFPVRQDEWQLIMGYNNSEFRGNAKCPVAPVTWEECQEFTKRLSYVMGTKFFLPTEAQWEYAARGGEKSHNYIFSGSDTFSEVGQEDYKNSVGQKKPNELGIYDMSGLVREWCMDNYGKYTDDEQINPTGPLDDSDILFKNEDGQITKVVRSPRNNETVTNRKGEDVKLTKGHKSYGLRVVCYNLPSFGNEQKEEELSASSTTPPKKKDDRENKTLDHQKKLVAKCHSNGFHFGRRDTLTAESRACAYGVFFKEYNKQDYGEYYKNNPYGWRDTAFLSAVIYSVIYVIFFLVYRELLGFHFIGFRLTSAYTVIGYYFCLWALVRMIKIDYSENGESFQPQIDLFNKTIGQKRFDSLIMTCCTLALSLIFTWYHKFDYLPLIIVIMIGTSVNMSMRINRTPWIIKKKFDNIHEEEDESAVDTIENPEGDIPKNYDWDLESIECHDHILHGNITLYFYAKDIWDLRQCNPFYQQLSLKAPSEYVKDMFKFLMEHRDLMRRVCYIAKVIKKKSANLSEIDKVQFVLDFVQEPNIQFVRNEDSKSIDMFKDYIRFPDETLYDKEADSASKAFLAGMIFHEIGYETLFMTSRKYQHAAIGVVIPKEYEKLLSGHRLEEISIVYENKRYFFCETTGDCFKIGNTIKDMSVEEDFDINVTFELQNDDIDDSETSLGSVTRIFNWELDKSRGDLKGNITINFLQENITDLRMANPFRHYPKDGHTYEQNVEYIFKFLTEQSVRMTNIRKITDYIKEVAKINNLSSFDTVQFALDFAQAPNIIYCVDEKSPGIDFAKEYMRYPDEVLFDKEGDCDCKSSLTAALFHELGYNVIFMLSEKLQHAAIGVEYKEEWLNEIDATVVDRVTREYNGKKYMYCETTSDGFRIGHIEENSSIQDFETIVEIKA